MAIPLLLIPLAIGVAGGGLSILDGYTQKGQYDEAARFANAEAELQADSLRKQGEAIRLERLAQERSGRRDAKRYRAALEASYAASGLNLSGTTRAVLTEQAGADEQYQQEANRVARYQRQVANWQAENALIAGKNTVKGYKAAGKNAVTQGYIGAATSALMGGVGAFGGAQTLMGDVGKLTGAGSAGNNGTGFMSGALDGSGNYFSAAKIFGPGKAKGSAVGPYRSNYKL